MRWWRKRKKNKFTTLSFIRKHFYENTKLRMRPKLSSVDVLSWNIFSSSISASLTSNWYYSRYRRDIVVLFALHKMTTNKPSIEMRKIHFFGGKTTKAREMRSIFMEGSHGQRRGPLVFIKAQQKREWERRYHFSFNKTVNGSINRITTITWLGTLNL